MLILVFNFRHIYHKLYKEQNYKNGELYHIKDSCENLNELNDFLESNLYLYSNDFESDINLKEENNRFFVNLLKKGKLIFS